MTTYSIELTNDEIQVAYAWHGGQGSMLYAAASTGALRRGSIRPNRRDEDDRRVLVPMTDAEWFTDLAERLESEASSAAIDCAERIERFQDGTQDREDNMDELCEQLLALESLANKASRAVAKLTKNT